MDFLQVDFINSVCPCAGLSMLNTSTAAGTAQKHREPTVLVMCPNTSHFSSPQGRNGVLTARQTSGCWTPLHLCWQGSGPRSDFHNIPFPTPPPVPTGALGRERSRLVHPDRGGGGEQAQADRPHLRLLLLVDQDQHGAARDPPEEDQNLLLLLAISHSANAPVPEKVNSSNQPQQRFFVIHQTSIFELCRPKKNLLEYLAEIPKTASQQDMFMAEGKASER